MSNTRKLSSYYIRLAKTPISEYEFSGEDVRFTSEYEALERELGKANSIHGNGHVDWLKVLDGSELLLREQSKDLRAAVWLTWALHQREALPGLLAGLGMLRHLCEHHWQTLYPLKMRTRSAAFNWLVPRMEGVLSETVPVKEQLPLFRQFVLHLEALDLLLTNHLQDEAPLLLPICRRLSGMVDRAANDQLEPTSISGVVTQVKQAASQFLSPNAEIDNEKDAHKSLRNLQEGARPLCAWWLRQKATDVRALKLNRTLLWLNIDSLPECNAEQITALRGLPADKQKNYQERLEQKQYADLLVELEASIARSPFWFDGQRMVWECLDGLNAQLAMREIEIHFALLQQRLPSLIELRFHDGEPFADEQTRAWISAQVNHHLQAPKTQDPQHTAYVEEPWDIALADALPVLRDEGLKAAVRLLNQGLQSAQGGRAIFFWQLSLARLCFSAKKYDLVKVQLETLDQQLLASGLNAWEPNLALEILHLLYRCCELMPQSNVVRECKDDVYRRLCHLDLDVILE
ncbi:type VI secretion system protein TssA [Pseudomonas marincola]|uniref:type VI secretion system protein TssA n=1 Tax=Pseudomonas marincola TaxID=437900 RepID=UPI0008F03D7A|nr:type VI secretion system protein TssA [Pseudomonas marincola]SFT53768.1 type VI secretion system protein VasJ [Pseudomonas marincola]